MKNLIPELIDDATFNTLYEADLFNDVRMRNYTLKREFRKMRSKGIKPEAAIEELRKGYPELQFESIKKIVQGNFKKGKEAFRIS